jgi:hypothetical protein
LENVDLAYLDQGLGCCDVLRTNPLELAIG